MPTVPELVDWSLAERVGRSVARTGPETTPAFRSDVRRDFSEFAARSDDLVREFTGLAPAEPAPGPLVLDRAGWIRANINGFSDLIRPLAEKMNANAAMTMVTRRVAGAALGVQLGVLLGYLSQKVLGQYDLVLATEGGGQVYFVGPNVVEAERRWGLEPRDFRLWIALHEITHRTQFTGVPWLRDRVRALIARSLAGIEMDPARLRHILARGRDLLLRGPAAWRSANVMDLLLSDEQRTVLGEMQALMTVVEGHGTFVMNRIGARVIPTYAQMKQALESRRGGAGGAEKVFQRAIGMDLKYEQYSLGERFCDAVADQAGTDAVNMVWESEGSMPTLEEMRAPASWLERVNP